VRYFLFQSDIWPFLFHSHNTDTVYFFQPPLIFPKQSPIYSYTYLFLLFIFSYIPSLFALYPFSIGQLPPIIFSNCHLIKQFSSKMSIGYFLCSISKIDIFHLMILFTFRMILYLIHIQNFFLRFIHIIHVICFFGYSKAFELFNCNNFRNDFDHSVLYFVSFRLWFKVF
jgi:hypothetical protein